MGQEPGSFYAHSLKSHERRSWQPLAEHLRAVAEGAGARGAKFGASKAASLAGLLHDLGKYAPAFQRRLDGAADRVDHSTAGAQEVVRAGANADDKIIAKLIAHAIAGHHAGLPDTIGDGASLAERLKRAVDPIDPSWRNDICAGRVPAHAGARELGRRELGRLSSCVLRPDAVLLPRRRRFS